MRIKLGRRIEKKIKGILNRLWLNQTNFSIISNNCWGTFIYKKYNLPYQSPFINLFIFSDDYLRLLQNFSPDILQTIEFISHENSRHTEKLKERGLFKLGYPIGVIGEKIELHFLHYNNEKDAKQKWEDRVKRINYDKILFKFSYSKETSDNMIRQFDALPLQHKISFTAKPFPECASVIYLPKFTGMENVWDEWKHSEKEYNLPALLNSL